MSEALKKRLQETQKQIAKLQAKMHKDGQKLLVSSLKSLFKKHKTFKNFSWTQYTPYFNDGDPCTFGVNKDYLTIDGESETSDRYDLRRLLEKLENKDKTIAELKKDITKYSKKKDYSWQVESLKGQIEEIEKADLDAVKKRLAFVEDIAEILDNIDESTFESMFGDHVTVVVSRDGIDTEAYEHD